jgi:hypothetical protein
MPVGARLSHHKSGQFFYITLMEYFLPGGVVVHHKGVVPDIEVKPADPTGETVERIWALREEGTLRRYAEGVVAKHPEVLDRVLGFSPLGFNNLPGLVETFQGFDTAVPPALVRLEIFRAMRLAREKKAGVSPLLKPREDRVLRRAVLELCKKLEINPRAVPEYRFVFRDFRRDR